MTSGETPDYSVAAGPSGKLLVRTAGGLRLMSPDGTRPITFFPNPANSISMSSCDDKSIVLDNDASTIELWRFDADGQNGTKIADDVVSSNCSPDGKWLLYTKGNRKLYRLSLEGGSPTELVTPSQSVVLDAKISPDSKSVLYMFYHAGMPNQLKGAIAGVNGGEPLHTFEYPEASEVVYWSPDGKGIQYLTATSGASNVWEIPIAIGPPHQVTDFTSGRIFDFAWSRDGKTLFLTKGEVTQDVVLMTKVR